MSDPHDLRRFVDAQEEVYDAAVRELRAGRKASHWMWFVFPQIAGLGHSDMARRYAIRDRAEARAYLAHPLLGARYDESAAALLAHRGTDPAAIMGAIDSVKLRSSLTLFDRAGAPAPVRETLDAFYDSPDAATLRLIAS